MTLGLSLGLNWAGQGCWPGCWWDVSMGAPANSAWGDLAWPYLPSFLIPTHKPQNGGPCCSPSTWVHWGRRSRNPRSSGVTPFSARGMQKCHPVPFGQTLILPQEGRPRSPLGIHMHAAGERHGPAFSLPLAGQTLLMGALWDPLEAGPGSWAVHPAWGGSSPLPKKPRSCLSGSASL